MKSAAELIVVMLLAGVVCCAVGCSTFSHQVVDSSVVDCRQQCQAGLEAARRGRDDSAQEMFATAVKTCPADQRARQLYADALWRDGEMDKAVKHMSESVRLSGGDPETIVRLGQMHLAQGDVDRAQQQAARAISTAPQLAEAWALEGDVLAQQQHFDVALARYHRALAYRNNYPEVQYAVADIYAQQGRHSRSLATLATLAHEYEPDRIPQRLHVMRGRSYRAMRRFGDAATELSLAVKAAPPTPDLLCELAQTLAASGETTAARMTAEQALAMQPQHVESRRLLAQLDRPSNGAIRRY